MLDRKYMKVQEQVDRAVAAGVSEIAEGCFLCEVIEAGVAKVTVVAAPAGTENVAGVALLPYYLPTSQVGIEKFVVPASGSLIFNLRYNNLVASSTRAAVAGGSDLIVDPATFSGTPATGTMKVDLASGRVKFAAGDAGKVVTVIYRNNLTVVQARQKYAERSINNRDLVGSLMQVGVLKGYIEIGTDQYDTTKDYSTGAALTLGANGVITIGGAGPVIPGGKVLAIPDISGTVQGSFMRISALIP